MKTIKILLVLLFPLLLNAQTYEIDAYNGQTVTTCSGTFYDSGGASGDYGNNENYTVTFCSNNGQRIAIDFSNVSISNGDALYIYYGTVIDGTPNVSFINNNGTNPAIIISTCQCITFVFQSNSSTVRSGWVGAFSCTAPPVVSNDYLVNATPHPLNGCLTSQTNISSTGDLSSGCFTSGNTVWYYINLSAGANTLNIVLQNSTFANVQYALVQDYICADATVVVVGTQCVTSSTPIQWTNLVDGIYWLGISSTIEGTFDLCITQSYTDYCGDDFCGSSESCLTCFVDCGACPEAVGEPYYHPIAGRQNTYVGQCMVTTCSGTYYDNGGPGVNYADNINQVYRTFCPNEAGDAISVTFSELGIASGDWLAILNGPTQNSPTIWKGYGTLPTPTTTEGIWSNPITSTHSSGCLTFRFYSSATTNAAGWTSNLSCVPHPLGLGPNATYNNDCVRARPICDDVTIQSEVWGPGLESEGCGSCVTSENWTEWYWVRVQTGGTMQFEVTPQGGSDMDFAIYKATDCDNLGSPLRCSYAAYVAPGKTGLSLAAGDLSEDVSGDQWVAELNVNTGDILFIMINEWYKTNPNAYNIDFTLTNGATFDCSITLPIVLSSFSGTRKAKNIIELNWVTATETNNHYFDLEKSINGVFYSIGKIIGAGTSNIERKYNYTDYDATESTEYYRLKQVDYDGHFEYFPVISVDEVIDTKDGIIVYPNPSQSELNIHIVCVEYINKITLIDITGKEYVIGKDIYCDGQTFIAISIADIPNGVYFIKFNTNKETFYYDNKIIIEKR